MIVRNPERTTIVELIPERPAVAAMYSDMLGHTATVDDLGRELLADFRDYLGAAGYRPATQNYYTLMIRNAWRVAFERELTTVNPGAKRTWFSTRERPPAPRPGKPPTVRLMPAPPQLAPLCKVMRVRDYLLHFFERHYRGDSNETRKAYKNAVSFFDKCLERDASVADFELATIDGLTKLKAGLTHKTQRGYVWRLRTIWRAAHKDKLVEAPPVDPRKRPKSPKNSGLPKGIRRRIAPVPQQIKPTVNLNERPATPRDFIAHHAVNNGLAPKSERGLHHRLNQFETALGRPMEWADFTDATFNTIIAAELARGVTPNTVRGMRAGVRTLWNSAWWAEILDKPPGRIRRIKLKIALPQCWTREELAKLAAQIEMLEGNLRSCPEISRKQFWRALVATAYYSGLRHGDLDALTWQNFRGDTLYVHMGKTGDMLSARLPADCMKLLEPLRAIGLKYVFSDLLSRGEQDEVFRRLLQAAGLPGSFKWLRRSGASFLESVNPGAAKGFLGHRTHGLAYRHYVDPTIAQQDKPIPPSIEGGDA